jgi:hypothetical protein
MKKAFVIWSLVLIPPVILFAQEKGAITANHGPCKAYFTVLEADEVTVGLPMLGLNKPQLSWFKKHGEDGRYSGICYWYLEGDKSQVSLAEFLNQEKVGATRLPSAPLYIITWGESLVTQTYSDSYQAHEQSTVKVTDENGNTSSGTITVPVTRSYSGTKRYYVATGILQRWDSTTQEIVPVAPLHNHNRTIFTSASTSLLKDGLEAVMKAEARQGK